MGEPGILDALGGETIAGLNPPLPQGLNPRHGPHLLVGDPLPINTPEGVCLAAIENFILLICQHGVVDDATIVGRREDNGPVDLCQLLLGKPEILQMKEAVSYTHLTLPTIYSV